MTLVLHAHTPVDPICSFWVPLTCVVIVATHPLIFSPSSHPLTPLMLSPSHPFILSPSSHPRIFSSSHPRIFSSSHPLLILSSSHPLLILSDSRPRTTQATPLAGGNGTWHSRAPLGLRFHRRTCSRNTETKTCTKQTLILTLTLTLTQGTGQMWPLALL